MNTRGSMSKERISNMLNSLLFELTEACQWLFREILFCVCLCVCGMNVYMCAGTLTCASACAYLCVHVETRGQPWLSFLRQYPSLA